MSVNSIRETSRLSIDEIRNAESNALKSSPLIFKPNKSVAKYMDYK